MFMTGMAGYAFYNLKYVGRSPARPWGQAFPTYYSLSALILVMVLYMMALATVQTWRSGRNGEEEPVEEEASDDNIPEPDETLEVEEIEGPNTPLPQAEG